MSSDTVDGLVNLANEAADLNDWPKALSLLQQADQVLPNQAGVLNGMGNCFLELGEQAQALSCFVRVAELLPDNADVHNNLGLVYQLNQQNQNAVSAYQKAVQLDNNHWGAWKNLASLYLQMEQWEQGVPILASIIRSQPQDLDAKYLLAQCYEIGEDYGSAQVLYEAILKESPQHAEARQALDNLAQRLPAGGKNDPVGQSQQRVAIYAPAGWPGELRMEMIAVAMSSQGTLVKVLGQFSDADLESFDYFIFSQPNLAPEWINAVKLCIAAGKPFGVDMEQDYFNIPQGHPAYALVGPGAPSALRSLEVILHDAAWVSVSSQVLAQRLAGYARDVRLNPPTWDRSTPLWQITPEKHNGLNIGWIGSHSDYGDLAAVRDEIVRFLRATPGARIVVAGDEAVYQRFGSLSEKQRLLIPLHSVKDIPQILSKIDILLVPWQDNPFNQAKSDQALLEAGICQIPWIASPIPSYRDWAVGGLFAEKPADWFSALNKLAGSQELRKQLGAAGRAQADRR